MSASRTKICRLRLQSQRCFFLSVFHGERAVLRNRAKALAFAFFAAFSAGCWTGEEAHDHIHHFQSMQRACSAFDYKNAFRSVFSEESAEAAKGKINAVFDCLIFETEQYKNAIDGEALDKAQLEKLLNEGFIKAGSLAPAIDKITHPDYSDRFLNLKSIAISLLGQQQAGAPIRHRRICRESGHKNGFAGIPEAAAADGADGGEREAWPAPSPHLKGVSKSEADVFIRFLEDARGFFLSLEDYSELIFEDLLQTDIAAGGKIPKSAFQADRGADQPGGGGRSEGSEPAQPAGKAAWQSAAGPDSAPQERAARQPEQPPAAPQTGGDSPSAAAAAAGSQIQEAGAKSGLAGKVRALFSSLWEPARAAVPAEPEAGPRKPVRAGIAEAYLLPLLEKHLKGEAPGFFRSISLKEAGRGEGESPRPAGAPHIMNSKWAAQLPPEQFERWKRKRDSSMKRHRERRAGLENIEKKIRRKKALRALVKMFDLHAAGSPEFLSRGNIRYAVFNIMLAERVFALYDSNGNAVLDESETDSLSCFVEPVISVIFSLFQEGREANFMREWMAEPKYAFYYTVKRKRLPGGRWLSLPDYILSRSLGGLEGSASLSYDEAVRVIEILFADFFPYKYMGGAAPAP